MNSAVMRLDKSVICPVFIGRENDLQLLDRLIMQSRGGNGQIALVSGEAGIGKSRLVKETKAQAANDALILEGQCFQTETALPYGPIVDLFNNFFGILSREEITRVLGSSAPELVKLFPELIVHQPILSSNPNPNPRQEKRRLFQALVQAIAEFAKSQPLIVIIEDLHWSDSASLEFLLLLARHISVQPIFLILTYRSEETTPELTHFLAELDRERLGTDFELKRMSPMEVAAMIQAILDLKTPVSREFLDIILPLTEGNPFFIEEILKTLIADGDIFYADGTWDRKEINQLRIPRTIQDAVRRRTQQLDEHTLKALTMAAVTGRRFDFRLLQELLGVDEGELTAMLKRLVGAQLVVEESVDQYSFRHALTREAIYTSLLLRERQSVHRTVGEAMEHLFAASINSHLADFSYHFYTAGVITGNPNPFSVPVGAAVNREGNLFVMDSGNSQIQKFDSEGNFLLSWGEKGNADGQFNLNSHGGGRITVDEAGNVYVGDSSYRIQKFDSEGKFILAWGSKGNGDGQFSFRLGIAVDAQGNVYVADGENHRIEKFDSNGVFLLQWGGKGSGDAELFLPVDVAVDVDGNVFTVEVLNGRVQKFNGDGTVLSKFFIPEIDDKIVTPGDIAVDSQGNIYITDWSNMRVVKLGNTGNPLGVWGEIGTGEGQFNEPWCVALDGRGNIYVVDTINSRIQKFQLK